MKIALAQMKMSKCILENYENALNLIRAAAADGAKLICFPEIQLSPFFPQYAGGGCFLLGHPCGQPDDLRGMRRL